jgi:hypothetical protein
VPLEVEVGITSALGRRYFELIHKLDQLMPLLQTLEIEEVITEKQVEQQRSRFKRIVLALSSMMRNFAMGCRRRMNEVDARKDEPEVRRAKSTIDNGAVAVVGQFEADRTHTALLAAPGAEDPPAVQPAAKGWRSPRPPDESPAPVSVEAAVLRVVGFDFLTGVRRLRAPLVRCPYAAF